MNCPRCGSPVMIRGDVWECGWCLDSGRLSAAPRPARVPLRFVCHVDLPEAWSDLKKALYALVPRHADALAPSLAHAAAHQLSLSEPPEDGHTEPLFQRELRAFLEAEKELRIAADTGSFWQSLLDALEDEGASPWEADTDGFFRTLALFRSWRRGGPGNDPDYLARCSALQLAFHERWEKRRPEE